MENKIFKYLEYLLPVHNCIIIPDFGAFIIDHEPALILSNGELIPPKHNVIFNPELHHNDGVLVSYLIKDANISYNVASQQVKDFVRLLKVELSGGKSVKCGYLGFLILDAQQNISFTSNKSYNTDLYGLTSLSIRRIADLDIIKGEESRRTSIRYMIGGVAAAVAALFLFVVPSTRIEDNLNSYQQSGFIKSLNSSVRISNDNKDMQSEVINNTITALPEPSIVASKSAKTYYIIVGGEDSKTLADRLLSRIQADSFPNASIVESGGRYRIYVASFDDKAEAEAYLDTFREENPKYKTAWLYSKRNK